MGKSFCFVPGCKTGYVSDRKTTDGPKRSLFTAQNMDQLEKWCRAIPRADKKISFNDAVCSLHFTEDNIDKYYETLLPDGTLWKMEKGRPSIKTDAIPSIFPDLPIYFSKVSRKRKPSAQLALAIEKRTKLDTGIGMSIDETNETFSFSTLVSNLVSISRPSVLWGITTHNTFVMCAKWNESHILEKRVIIDCDLKVQVYLKDRKVNFLKQIIVSIADLSSILKEVNNYVICLGVDDIEKTGCHLYLPPNSKSHYCKDCRLIQNQEVNRRRKRELCKAGSNGCRHQKLYEKIRCANRKNYRLKQKVLSLQKRVDVLKLKCSNASCASLFVLPVAVQGYTV